MIKLNRAARAVFCSALILSQHVMVNANSWFMGHPSRSSTLAVAAPGGRDRPVRDWKAISRNANKRTEESGQQAAKKVTGAVEVLEQAPPDSSTGDVEETGEAEAAPADILYLEKTAPGSLVVVLSKVAVFATVGIYGAKKAVAFTKAFFKARKEAAAEASTAGMSTETGDEAEGQDEATERGGEEAEEALAVTDSDGDDNDQESHPSR